MKDKTPRQTHLPYIVMVGGVIPVVTFQLSGLMFGSGTPSECSW